MWVPATLAESTSPSPAKPPPTIWTVALARSRLSGSVTESVGDSGSVLPSVKPAVAVSEAAAGASLTAVRWTVVVAAALAMLKSSFTTQVMVRVGSAP